MQAMIQLILHLIGDYVTQSHWMAQNKTKSNAAALAHATVYAIPFSFFVSSQAWLIIWATHFFIDRFRLARLVVMSKNIWGDPDWWNLSNREVWMKMDKYNTPTGYPEDSPSFLSVWLLIAADNTLHLAINYAAIAFFP